MTDLTEINNGSNEKKIDVGLSHTPSIDNLILTHRIKLEDEKLHNTWKSFCFTLDRRAVMYFTQIGIIGGATSKTCDIFHQTSLQ
jgi:hypothetical protein